MKAPRAFEMTRHDITPQKTCVLKRCIVSPASYITTSYHTKPNRVLRVSSVIELLHGELRRKCICVAPGILPTATWYFYYFSWRGTKDKTRYLLRCRSTTSSATLQCCGVADTGVRPIHLNKQRNVNILLPTNALLFNIWNIKIYIKTLFTVTPTCFVLCGPSSGSLYWA